MKQIILLLLAITLNACGGLSKQGAAPALYDFGIAPSFSESAIPARLTRIGVIHGLESYDIRYRLAYQNPNQVFSYTQSRWGVTPTDLLAQRLRHKGFSPTVAVSPCNLRVTLETFEQIFDSPDSSKGVVSIRAELIKELGQKAQSSSTLISAEVPATSADAKGGVAALSAATDKAVIQLTAWLMSSCH